MLTTRSWGLWFILLVDKSFMKCDGTSSATSRPNIVFILADDLGWNDVGFHGSRQIPTPNLDALAYDGTILANYYVQPLCTPSRAALMTGRYPIRVGLQHDVIYSAQPYGLFLNETIMPQYLKELGYDAHIVGKWHLGFFAKEYTPLHRGFDSHMGYYQGCEDYYDHTYAADGLKQESWGLDFRHNKSIFKTAFGQYSTELFTRQAENIINNHNTSKPLYLYLPFQAVHSGNDVTPLEAPWKYLKDLTNIKSANRRLYAGMLSALDDAVGNITKSLFKRGILNNTIIVFSTDNGGPANGFDKNDANNWPLRGLKATIWEGGTHGVGFIWSPLLEKSRRISHQMLHVTDWLPTLLHAAGYDMSKLPDDLDGFDQWDSISRDMSSKRTEFLTNIDPVEKSAALRSGDMKVLVAANGYTTHYNGWYPPDEVTTTLFKDRPDDLRMYKNGFNPYLNNTFLDNSIRSFERLRDYEKLTKEKWDPELRPSDVYEILLKIGRDGIASPHPFVISCGPPPANASTNCEPWKAPCLFNITADPCEFNNLAQGRQELVKALLEKIERYAEHSIPPINQPVDDKGLPYHHDGLWVPWVTLEEVEKTENLIKAEDGRI